MKKDFTIEAEQRLIEAIKAMQPQNFFEGIGDWFGDIWLRINQITGQLNIKNYTDNIQGYQQKMLDMNDTAIGELKKIFRDVRNIDDQYANYVRENNDKYLYNLNTFVNILALWINPQKGNLKYGDYSLSANLKASTLRAFLSDFGNPAYIYNDGKHYGGNQSNPVLEYWKYEDIVRKYYPEYTDEEIEALLRKMEHEGCGYMALVNTIFGYYAGRPDDFERNFGFPMYDKDGYPNYNALMVDLYCSEDSDAGVRNKLFDYEKDEDYQMSGTDAFDREKALEHYIRVHGGKVDVVNNVNVTIHNFDKLSRDGEIILSMHPVVMIDENGKKLHIDAGHAVAVTGVTPDGKYIVSSWGKKYYVDPKDFEKGGRLTFQQVKYG